MRRKIERELGFCPRESFETGIRKTLAWYLAQRGVVAGGDGRQLPGVGGAVVWGHCMKPQECHLFGVFLALAALGLIPIGPSRKRDSAHCHAGSWAVYTTRKACCAFFNEVGALHVLWNRWCLVGQIRLT